MPLLDLFEHRGLSTAWMGPPITRAPATIKPYLAKAHILQIASNDIKKLTVDVQPDQIVAAAS